MGLHAKKSNGEGLLKEAPARLLRLCRRSVWALPFALMLATAMTLSVGVTRAYAGPLEDLGHAVVSLFSGDGPSDGASDSGDGDAVAATSTRVADDDTRNSYTFALGSAGSTRNAGRIWTDKTVSTDSVNFSGTIDNDGDGSPDHDSVTVALGDGEDFLVTYSALATTQEITSLPKVPVDVVFVLDLSASMNWGQHAEEAEGTNDEEACENSRIKAMVDALNASIEELVKDNPENRIGIAVFNGTAKTLMELTSAEKILEEGKDGEK